MWMRMAPPGRASTSQTGAVKPCGPHHCATRFGSVHAANTSARGALNVRVRPSSRSVLPGSGRPAASLAGMSLLLSLYLAQVVVQTVEGRCPEPPVVPHPIGHLLERACLEPARPPLRPLASRDQPGALQYLEMLGNPWEAHLEEIGRASCRERV